MRPHRVLLVTVEQLELSILWFTDKQESTPSRQQCLCKACVSDIVKASGVQHINDALSCC